MRLIPLLGLLPFIICFIINLKLSFYGIIPLIVFINGILFHGYFPNSLKIRLYDIFVNVLLCIYINVQSKNQPYILIITSFTLCVYLINSTELHSDIIHVVCIQWVLLHLYNNSYIN